MEEEVWSTVQGADREREREKSHRREKKRCRGAMDDVRCTLTKTIICTDFFFLLFHFCF